VEKESLWYRVLSARYKEEGGFLLDGGRHASAWWRTIAALHKELWFRDHASRLVGNGKHIYFWSDVWIGGVSIRDGFSRLFDLSMSKWVSVFEMFQLGWEVNGDAWKWRCRLFAWEEEQVGELCLLLQNVTLQVDKEDMWLWTLEKSNVYSVRSAYNHLTSQHTADSPVAVKSLWHKDIPLKVVVFAWRLFQNRLPTKDNLFRRGAINHDSCLCVAGCGSLETLDHLFFHCSFFGSVWNNILHWIGLSMALPFVASDHFNQFDFGGGGPRVRHSFMCVIWFATV